MFSMLRLGLREHLSEDGLMDMLLGCCNLSNMDLRTRLNPSEQFFEKLGRTFPKLRFMTTGSGLVFLFNRYDACGLEFINDGL